MVVVVLGRHPKRSRFSSLSRKNPSRLTFFISILTCLFSSRCSCPCAPPHPRCPLLPPPTPPMLLSHSCRPSIDVNAFGVHTAICFFLYRCRSCLVLPRLTCVLRFVRCTERSKTLLSRASRIARSLPWPRPSRREARAAAPAAAVVTENNRNDKHELNGRGKGKGTGKAKVKTKAEAVAKGKRLWIRPKLGLAIKGYDITVHDIRLRITTIRPKLGLGLRRRLRQMIDRK